MSAKLPEIRVHNTLTRRRERLEPLEPGHVRMYVCGMTVYDLCHLGHARVLVVFDTFVRYLRSVGYRVTYVRNVTDIDDKIIARARELGVGFRELTERYIAAMHEDAAALGVLAPDHEPRATGNVDAIVDLIGRLLERGYAYRAPNGDVYYDVSRFEGYGALSGKRPEELRAGARVAVEEAKDDPLDFALWKAAKPGEPSWDSPWGPGRPGWHIECSAMSMRCLGEQFDIHGGGADLVFPHHENEIAQSEAATGRHPFVRTWMHVGFVQVDEEKMSKSLGNFFTIREILARHRPEAVRAFILGSHYRSPLNYTAEALTQAEHALERLYTALRGLELPPAAAAPEPWAGRFHAAMADDLGTPEALAVLHEMAREVNRLRDAGRLAEAARLGAGMRTLGAPLGLLQADPEAFLKAAPAAGGEGPDEAEIERLVAARAEARRRRDWAEADRIRDTLREWGVVLEDTPEGTVWRRAVE